MLRWTTSHKIPINPLHSAPDTYYITKSAQYGNDVLIVTETPYRRMRGRKIEMFIFRTDTLSIEVVDCPSINIIQSINSIIVHNNQVYLWELRRDDDYSCVLYELDMKTMILDRIIRISGGYGHQIIGEEMFVLKYRDMDVYAINLKTKTIRWMYKLNVEYGLDEGFDFFDILEKNGKLYFLQRGYGHERIVYEIKDEQLELLKEDQYEEEGAEWYFDLKYEWSNGTMFIMNREEQLPYYSVDIFDFDDYQWNRHKVEKGWINPRMENILTFVNINDTIYAVTKIARLKYVQLELRVLELKPKLTSICLIRYVDKVISGEVIREQFSIPLRKKLDNMINWRLAEKESQRKWLLVQKQDEAIVTELKMMIEKGEVEPEVLSTYDVLILVSKNY